MTDRWEKEAELVLRGLLGFGFDGSSRSERDAMTEAVAAALRGAARDALAEHANALLAEGTRLEWDGRNEDAFRVRYAAARALSALERLAPDQPATPRAADYPPDIIAACTRPDGSTMTATEVEERNRLPRPGESLVEWAPRAGLERMYAEDCARDQPATPREQDGGAEGRCPECGVADGGRCAPDDDPAPPAPVTYRAGTVPAGAPHGADALRCACGCVYLGSRNSECPDPACSAPLARDFAEPRGGELKKCGRCGGAGTREYEDMTGCPRWEPCAACDGSGRAT